MWKLIKEIWIRYRIRLLTRSMQKAATKRVELRTSQKKTSDSRDAYVKKLEALVTETS